MGRPRKVATATTIKLPKKLYVQADEYGGGPIAFTSLEAIANSSDMREGGIEFAIYELKSTHKLRQQLIVE